VTRVALIVLDTLRKDAFDKHFEWLPGTRFENAWSTSHWTAPAHASMFTGLYPVEHGVHAKSPVFGYPKPSLAEQLSDVGVRTRAFSTNAYASPSFDFDRGFDEFTGDYRMRCRAGQTFDWYGLIDEMEPGVRRYIAGVRGCLKSDNTLESFKNGVLIKAMEEGLWSPRDSGITAAIDWVRSSSFTGDQFLFANLMEAHSPYLRLPEKYRPPFGPEEIPVHPTVEHTFEQVDDAKLREAYDHAIWYLSDRYRVLFDELINRFDYVLTVADHGELLGEGGFYGHNYGLFPELTHVPVVVSSGTDRRERRSDVVSLLDVHATLLDLFDVVNDSSRGRSLVADTLPDVEGYLTQSAGLQTRFLDRVGGTLAINKYDTSLSGIATTEGYAFESDGKWNCPDSDVEFERLIETLTEDLRDPPEDSNTEVDDATEAHLRDLGYA